MVVRHGRSDRAAFGRGPPRRGSGVRRTARARSVALPVASSFHAGARAYLDANCGYCHSATGSARTTGLLLGHQESSPRALGICKPPVAAGGGSGDLRFDVVPGRPDESIVIHRMRSTDPQTMMPELGRSLAHDEAIALVSSWIEALPGACP